MFLGAAEDIRRLLHQFAAGFLKEPDPAMLPALQAILETEFLPDSLVAQSTQPPEPEAAEVSLPQPAIVEAAAPVSRLGAEFEAGAELELPARRQLERTDGGLKHVASAAGFGSIDVMRRAFVRVLGITPRRYREFTAQSGRD